MVSTLQTLVQNEQKHAVVSCVEIFPDKNMHILKVLFKNSVGYQKIIFVNPCSVSH